MMTLGMFDELLKPKQPNLIVEQKKNRYIAYFSKSPSRKGIGHTETEALENLKKLIDDYLN